MKQQIAVLICLLSLFILPSTVLAQRGLPTPTPTPARGFTFPTFTPTPTPSPVRQLPTAEPTIFSVSPTATPQPTVFTSRGLPQISASPTPTPIPEINNTFKLEYHLKDSKILLSGEETNSDSHINFEIASTSAALKTINNIPHLTFASDGQEVLIPIKVDFAIEGADLVLKDNNNELNLKIPPPAFWLASQTALTRGGAQYEEIELTALEQKPMYIIKINERMKFLGLIPYRSRTTLKVNGEDHGVKVENRSFWSHLSTKTDWNKLFTSGKNIVIKEIKTVPFTFRPGEKAQIWAYMYNIGFEDVWHGVDKQLVHTLIQNGVELGTDKDVFVAQPGGWVAAYFEFNIADCEHEYTITADANNLVKEYDENDNTYKFKLTCSPQEGPDLVVSKIYFPDNYTEKVFSQTNKVEYTIKNIGTKDSIPVQALATEGEANYASLIQVPVLKPGGQYSSTFNYTPLSCDKLTINIDAQNKMLGIETNRDNNVGEESASTAFKCKAKPDLKFGQNYWTVDGFSFAKSKLPHGSNMTFKTQIVNPYFQTCAYMVKLKIYENEKEIKEIYYGHIGNSNCGGTGGVAPNGILQAKDFSITPTCGSTLTFKIDPENSVWEKDEGNNVWIHKVECE